MAEARSQEWISRWNAENQDHSYGRIVADGKEEGKSEQHAMDD